jgi:hypothetical protein
MKKDNITLFPFKKDINKTDVIFRKFKEGDIIALFPYEIESSRGNILSYMHNGQHSEAMYLHCVSISKLATETEYNDLKNELESIGYNLNIIKKQYYKKYRQNYRNYLAKYIK